MICQLGYNLVMNIVILNWRDLKNPDAGGAEQLTHEMAKRWVVLGHSVTQLSAGFKSGNKQETIDGVSIIRMGRWCSVHFLAGIYYILHLRKFADIVVDEVHWFPFFSILYAPRKTILLACEVAESLFSQVLPFPLDRLGQMLERFYLWLYRHVQTLAISPSTKHDLISKGFDKALITVLPMGLTIPDNFKLEVKETRLTLAYLGRINIQKGAFDVVETLKLVIKTIPDIQLWFIGKGEKTVVNKLKHEVDNSGLSNNIKFFGYVEDSKKFRLLSKAHLLIVSSIHEGWGLTIPEAGFVGTPAIVYRSAGLKDVVKDEVSGLVVEQTPFHMADAIERVLQDKDLLIKLRKNAKGIAQEYSWDNTAQVALKKFETMIH
ncbi:hypothetical protein COW99_02680 [Candidatus Roizmanbacteria bacterium CG22_combo_CG10-13_8_21_14_all_38_20]|uniref:Glycosyl transferase family 1 domain-containing protein n=1 Tax=Candidatus Roizmanbacteria bacterium CG22_combo_CG10-13_8_21_14_all_38_20 TaxID=1974862 RepID=A0A2H0BVV3_9BACT|nr:MAG: hypothetical protein COW99_02680 [Candidatus Roizmanbacteria bacterium CG22_combo_CG10-13_8_21_14_all_38_20]PJC32069.1 MAG: hypothetical protein CO050_01065 [Candidatus Roizmanbacteria bacterium CG_4_9_14_0_2_um_filter_38_17]